METAPQHQGTERKPLHVWEIPVVFTVLLLHALLAFQAVSTKGLTFDEIAHLAAGHGHWAHAAYQLNPENGMLPQKWAALAPIVHGWSAPNPLNPAWQRADIWTLGEVYLFANHGPYEPVLLDARGLPLLWSALLGLLVWHLSRSLWGTGAGLFSLGMFCLSPTILANGPLVTSDMCGAFFLVASVWAFSRHLCLATTGSLILSSLILGLAFMAKFNALLLLPTHALILLWSRLTQRSTRHVKFWASTGKHLGLGLLAHTLGTLVIIWAFHDFGLRNSPVFAHHYFEWTSIAPELGWKAQTLQLLAKWHILPKDYLHGLATVLYSSTERPSYLLGECSSTGWWYYFPVCFLTKTNLSALLGLAAIPLSLALESRRARSARERFWTGFPELVPLVTFGLVFSLVALSSNLNIGQRHILPLYPLLFVFLGGLWPHSWRLHRNAFCGLLLLGQAAETLWTHPNYLSHFSPLLGASAKAHQVLADSSIDWGQELPALQEYLEKHKQTYGRSTAYLAYAGIDSIPRQCPSAKPIASVTLTPPPYDMGKLKEGLYCVSIAILEQIDLTPRDWNASLEEHYQQHRLTLEKNPFPNPQNLSPLQTRLWASFTQLRMMRLCNYLRVRKEDANINGCILVYHLKQEEIDAVLYGPLSAWLKAMDAQEAQQ